ncbi:MAG: TonB-dependent receptor [Reichenbachiella sp.]|uniref:SusC/RagA family TonB-linked outer membrane protein n=1 Tax=Reichenbachiella sp. TaxID=2184521 RepID=UPI003262EBC4
MKPLFRTIFFCLLQFQLIAQSINIRGTVTNGSYGLPGASIIIKGTTKGTITDVDGNFELSAPEFAILSVSFIGYKTKEVLMTNDVDYQIELEVDAQQLEELIVVGYGSVKRRDVTGSISSIKPQEMMNTVVSSIDQGIQGKAPGVVVTFGSGQPGSGSTIRIRGTSSILGTLEPLYVIDGVPISNPQNVGAVSGPVLNPLETINPSDIESIEILKDASATAIYGTRGANGVIMVTTKRGKEGSAIINLGYATSLQELQHKIPILNAAQLAELGNEAADNAGVDRRNIYASPVNLGVGTDWQDEIFRVAPMHNVQAAVRGGTEHTNYSISTNFFTQDGIIIESSFTKANFRLNLDQEISERIKVGTSLNLNRSVLEGVVTDSESAIPSSVTSWALEFNPGLPVIDEDGNFTYKNNTNSPPVGNPVADAKSTDQQSKSTRVLGNVYLEWDILNHLKFKTFVSTDAYFNKEQSFVPNDVLRGQEKGQAGVATSNGLSWMLENTLNYKVIFGSHDLNVLIGHSLQSRNDEFLFAATSDFDDNRLGYDAIQAGKEKTFLVNGASSESLQSFLGRLNYGFKNKYLLTLSARIDGSSKFGSGNRYGVFPSLGAAWRIYEEDFLIGSKLISDMKIRFGIGRVGNEGIPPYQYLGLLETTEAYFGENEIAKGSGPSSPSNNTLKWETTDQIDIGVDIGLFNNRLTVVSDVYLKKTKDLLFISPLPYTTGYKSATVNIGNLENRGVEFSFSSVNVDRQFIWKTNFNIAFNENEITKTSDGGEVTADPLLGVNGWSNVEEGQPINNFYGYQSDGIIQSGDDLSKVPTFFDYVPGHGDRKYVDQDSNGILDENDIVRLGNANPDFSYGLGNTFSYKGWSLNIFLQGIFGNEVINFNRFSLESFDGTKNNSAAALERWTPSNPTNDYPRANADPRRSNTLSDVQVEDGSYLKVRDITLSYNFTTALLNKLKISSFKVYVSGKNLWVFSDYSGYDPEVNRFGQQPLRSGVDYGSYPTVKIFTLGANLTF